MKKVNNIIDIYNNILDKLEERYPNVLPTSIETSEETARRIGQQDVIKFLIAEVEVMNNADNKLPTNR